MKRKKYKNMCTISINLTSIFVAPRLTEEQSGPAALVFHGEKRYSKHDKQIYGAYEDADGGRERWREEREMERQSPCTYIVKLVLHFPTVDRIS